MNEKMYFCDWPSFEDSYPRPPMHRPAPCTCECECWEHETKCEHRKPHCPCHNACDEDINLFIRQDCMHKSQPHHPSCYPDFAKYLCDFIGQKVLITIGSRRGKAVILEVCGSVVKCLAIGNGKIVYLNIERIDSISPLCC